MDISGARDDFKTAYNIGVEESKEWINIFPNMGNAKPFEETIDMMSWNSEELEMETLELARKADLIGALGAIKQAVSLYPKLTHLIRLQRQIETKLGIA